MAKSLGDVTPSSEKVYLEGLVDFMKGECKKKDLKGKSTLVKFYKSAADTFKKYFPNRRGISIYFQNARKAIKKIDKDLVDVYGHYEKHVGKNTDSEGKDETAIDSLESFASMFYRFKSDFNKNNFAAEGDAFDPVKIYKQYANEEHECNGFKFSYKSLKNLTAKEYEVIKPFLELIEFKGEVKLGSSPVKNVSEFAQQMITTRSQVKKSRGAVRASLYWKKK